MQFSGGKLTLDANFRRHYYRGDRYLKDISSRVAAFLGSQSPSWVLLRGQFSIANFLKDVAFVMGRFSGGQFFV